MSAYSIDVRDVDLLRQRAEARAEHDRRIRRRPESRAHHVSRRLDLLEAVVYRRRGGGQHGGAVHPCAVLLSCGPRVPPLPED
jgi:hypothetical protein